ncbi:MAG: hypothetical protein AAF290_14710 [Pseudomonadota bacterium]
MPTDPLEQILILAGLFLLLAAAGFLFGRFGGDDDDEPGAFGGGPLNSEYLKGLNFLLNDQNDQALEHFIRLVQVDDQTIETHFALGSLFRRRGEVDRAIRVHQNIIARPDLGKDQRDQALFALARDYLNAGLLDRAENLFAKLAEDSGYKIESLQNLCKIYEQEHEWANAVIAARQLESLKVPNVSAKLSNYYCELAQTDLDKGDIRSARDNVKLSQAKRDRLTRGAILRGEIALQEDDKSLALKMFAQVLAEDGAYLIELLPKLQRLHGDDVAAFDQQMEGIAAQRASARQEIARAALQWPDIRSPFIDAAVATLIDEDPVLASFVDTQLILDTSNPDLRRQAIERIRTALGTLASEAPRYRCTQCGFSSRQLLWQCPGCRSWESLRPIDKVRFDTLIERDGGINY